VLLEEVGLFAFVTRIVLGAGSRFLAWEAVVIEAGFAEGDHFGMTGEFA